MDPQGVDEIDTTTPARSIPYLLNIARAEVVTPEEVTQRLNRAMRLCNGETDADFATASLSTRDNGIGRRDRNNSPLSLNQQDGLSLGALSLNPRPAAAEYEVNRLATFRNWPSTAPVTPQALARAGFFYLGRDDIVECFSCQGQIRDFEYGDTAIGEHKKHFPRCQFVKNSRNHGNVPMTKAPDFSIVASTSEPGGATGFESTEKNAKEKEAALFSSKDAEKMVASAKEKKGNGGNGAGKKEQHAKKQSVKASPKLDEQDPATKADNQTKFVFKSEFKRLLSYQNWPESSHADPRDCAKAGFYYTGKEDIVQCFACYGKISNFKAGDVPMVEHNRNFPSCPYILGLDVGNQPITVVEMANALQAIKYKERSMFGHVAQKQQKTKRQLSQTAKPTADWAPGQKQNQKRVFAKVRHPQFSSEQARVESFDCWPPAVGIAPIQLSRAGFFYTGSNDSCKCFYCDGGLKNWEPKDEPWMEHARWFPRCEWLIQQRGQAYVDYVVHNFPPPRVSADVLSAGGYRKKFGTGAGSAGEDEAGDYQTAHMAVAGSSGTSAAADPSDDKREPEARKTTRGVSEIEDMMKSKTTQTVLDMGYDSGLIRAVLRHQWNTKNKPFTNAQDLLEALFAAEVSGIVPENEPAVGDDAFAREKEAAKLYGAKDKNVCQIKKEMKNLSIVEDQQKGNTAASPKGCGAGKLTFSAYADKLGGHDTAGVSSSERPMANQTSPQGVGGSMSAMNEDNQPPLPATVLEIKREIERIRDSQLCKICMDKEMSTVFLPCNHMVACDECSQALSLCPICRKKIRNVVHIYKT